ncbi:MULTISPECIES: chemotaxis protein [Piscirickettsiaceae]|uniref:Response regulator n=1 Tax=Hydrogenovibrio thermophilus TaxID=265883 RepID=A0A410H454_9GAMM|nr:MULTISPECIES: chemotaxis protein [Piscirickettsiaceae]AZR81868.1 chemotaxis protein CheW [Thiomicrospira sp. S5]QAB15600.1 response regulator [Hydrogenovibrio thermophilus]
MSSFLKGVDQRTSLAGMNRMELLLFKIHGNQLFGINVFKVREVIRTPFISPVPKADSRVVGVSDIRGQTMPMIDLAKSLDLPAVPADKYNDSLTIVTEFNSSVQGFLVEDVDRIVHLRWEDILPPPDSLQNVNYLTGITRAQDQIVEIVDVEKVLAEVSGMQEQMSDEFLHHNQSKTEGHDFFVLAADDSAVARNQLKTTLDKLGITNKIVTNGRLALDFLKKWADDADKDISPPVKDRVLMVISDIEMPEMDGYTLTTNIRKDPRLSDLYVVLSSSLSGGFNATLTEKVGANKFMSKWHPEELAQAIIDRIDVVTAEKQQAQAS